MLAALPSEFADADSPWFMLVHWEAHVSAPITGAAVTCYRVAQVHPEEGEGLLDDAASTRVSLPALTSHAADPTVWKNQLALLFFMAGRQVVGGALCVHAARAAQHFTACRTLPHVSDVLTLVGWADTQHRVMSGRPVFGAPLLVADSSWLRHADQPRVVTSAPLSQRTGTPMHALPIPNMYCEPDGRALRRVSADCLSVRTEAGGVLFGPAAGGKFTTLMRAMHTDPDPPSPLRAKGTLCVVPHAAVAWRAAQLRRQHPTAALCVLTTRAHARATTWRDVTTADFVVTTVAFLRQKCTYDRAVALFTNVLQAPTELAEHVRVLTYNSTGRRVAQKRSRSGAPLAHASAPTSAQRHAARVYLGIARETASPPAAHDHFPYLRDCATGVLERVPGVGLLPDPILELYMFRRVVFVDADRLPLVHLLHVRGSRTWATATTHASTPALVCTWYKQLFQINKEAPVTYAHLHAHALRLVMPRDTRALPPAIVDRVCMTPYERAVVAVHGLGADQLLRQPAAVGTVGPVKFVRRADMAATTLAIGQEYLLHLQSKVHQLSAPQHAAAALGDLGSSDDDDDDEDDDNDNNDDVYAGEDDDASDTSEDNVSVAQIAMYRAVSVRAQVDRMLANAPSIAARVLDTAARALLTEECSICCDAVVSAMYTCGHAFCTACALEWAFGNRLCPACDTVQPRAFAAVVDAGVMPPCPVPEADALWLQVWRDHTLPSKVFWFSARLALVEAADRRAVMLVHSTLEGMCLARALQAAGHPVVMVAGHVGARSRAMTDYAAASVHVLAQIADVVAGAGMEHVTDVLCEDLSPRIENWLEWMEAAKARLRTGQWHVLQHVVS